MLSVSHKTREAILTIQSSRGNINKAVAYLRNEATMPEQVEAIKLFADKPPKILPNISGTIKATKITEIWTPPGLEECKREQKSICWIASGIIAGKEILNNHIIARDAIWRSILNGDFDAAQGQLEYHLKEFGFTLWNARCALVLAEESGGEARSNRLLEMLLEQSNGSPVSMFFEWFAKATNKSMTESRFRSLAKSAFKKAESRGFFELILLADLESEIKLASVCKWLECLPLIDRYEFFIKLCVLAGGCRHADSDKILKYTSRISLHVNDEAVLYFNESQDSARIKTNSMNLFKSWDEYITGNYKSSMESSEKIAKIRPWLIPAHEIFVKSNMHNGNALHRSAKSIAQSVQFHLFNIYARNEDLDESLASILRLSTRMDLMPLTFSLRAIYSQHAEPDCGVKWQSIAARICGIHSPRNMESCGLPADCNKYLTRCAKTFPDYISPSFFLAIDEGALTSAVERYKCIPPARVTFYAGLAHARNNRMLQANANLEQFQKERYDPSVCALAPYAVEEARRVMVDLYRRTANYEQLLKIVVAAYIDRSQSIRRIPITAIYHECAANRDESAKHIEFAILSAIALTDPHQICLCLRRCLKAHGVSRPSDLITSGNLDRSILGVLFLKVCTSDVLDSLPGMSFIHSADQERLMLLEWIRDNVTHYANFAKMEIAKLTQNAELRDALDNLNQAKVVLDLGSLRSAEKSQFTEAYIRFQSQRDLAMTLVSDDIISALMGQICSNKDKPFNIIQVSRSREYEVAGFIDAFREITRVFLSSPYYGLEASLSGQIRHGIIIKHIRNPLIERKLAYRKSGATYSEVERHWAEIINCPQNDEKLVKVLDILDSLTCAVDAIAQDVKESWIQSKTDSEASGLFDYSFDDNTLRSIYSAHDFANASADSFLDLVFDILVKRTRDSLKVVRHKIGTSLRKSLLDAVDYAIASLASLEIAPANLRNALTSCRQDIETNVCPEMIKWFNESNATLMANCDFNLVARTAIGMVERLNPALKGKFTSVVNSEFDVRSRHFRALVFMIFFMLDNAVQHSGVPASDFSVEVKIKAMSNRLEVIVTGMMSNDLVCKNAEAIIQERIAQHQREFIPESVIREGGSGLAKLISTIKYEFQQSTPNLWARSSGSRLSVNLVCEMAGLAV